MSRPIALALGVVVALAGCGQSEEDQALDLAREACATYEEQADATASTINVKASAAEHDDAANRAARAARLDPTWDKLAEGYDQVAGFFGFLAGLPTRQGRPSQSDYTADQQRDLAERVKDVEPAVKTVGAECRKTS